MSGFSPENSADRASDAQAEARRPVKLTKAMESYSGQIPENDLVHMFLPLMRQVAALHAQGRVADIKPDALVENPDGSLALADPDGFPISTDFKMLREVEPHASSTLNIVGDVEITKDNKFGNSFRDKAVAGPEEEINRPLYVSGYNVWEEMLGHHDERTDVFAMGQLLAALSCDLDFESEDDIGSFAATRTNLFRLNPRLHPVVASLIENMTPLARRERLGDLGAIAARLENYREEVV